MFKFLLTLFILSVSNALNLGGFYQFKSDQNFICRSDHYGTFLIHARTSGSFEELKFKSFFLTYNANLVKLKKEYAKLKSKRASTKTIRAKKSAIDNLSAIISEATNCRAGKVNWVNKVNFSTACSVLGGTALKTPGAIIAGERCLEGNSPTARLTIFFSEQFSSCTGVLVAPNIVATAAHCVQGAESVSVSINRVVREVSSFTNKSNYNERDEFSENNDIGLVYLKNNVTDVTPAQIYSGGTFIKNETMIIGGYGLDATGGINILRSGFMFLSSVTSGAIYSKFLGRESNTCSGDSGGPLYGFRDGSWKVLGLVSGGNGRDCAAPELSTFARLGGSNTQFLNANGVF